MTDRGGDGKVNASKKFMDM